MTFCRIFREKIDKKCFEKTNRHHVSVRGFERCLHRFTTIRSAAWRRIELQIYSAKISENRTSSHGFLRFVLFCGVGTTDMLLPITTLRHAFVSAIVVAIFGGFSDIFSFISGENRQVDDEVSVYLRARHPVIVMRATPLVKPRRIC